MLWIEKISNTFKKYKAPLIIGSFGLSFLFLGVLIELSKASLFLSTVGSVLLIIAIGDGVLLVNVEMRIAEVLSRSFPLAAKAFVYGLEAIYDSRNIRKPQLKNKTFESIAGYLENYLRRGTNSDAKTIKLFGISLRDFFGGDKPTAFLFHKLLRGSEVESFKYKELKVNAIILDPDSEAAKRRATEEKVSPKRNTVNEDIQDTITYCRSLPDSHWPEGVTLHVKTTRVFPPAYFVITEEFIFIEQYHIGRDLESEAYFCLGGTLPMLKFNKGSDYYHYFNKQFDFFWHVEDKQEENQYYGVKSICQKPQE